jgi:DNA-binding transcriptional LysR family regulator
MELKWLEDLLVLLEEQSISRAAERRHVTQPAYLALEEAVRDLVNRFYALRNSVHETSDRVTFVAQHTLAISRFPAMMRRIKAKLPQSSYRVVPANYEECEALFYHDSDLLLCYQSALRQFDFSHKTVRKLDIGSDSLIPVASQRLAAQLGPLSPGMAIPLLMYQQGGFLADTLAGTCMPEVIRDYRVESICESAFSASLKEMVLADMGIAWLARDIIDQELAGHQVVSFAAELGQCELDIVLFYRDAGLAARVGELIADFGVKQ